MEMIFKVINEFKLKLRTEKTTFFRKKYVLEIFGFFGFFQLIQLLIFYNLSKWPIHNIQVLVLAHPSGELIVR